MDGAASFGLEPGNVSIGGESAGGNLAASVSLSPKGLGRPLPRHQLPVYPVTDWTRSADRSIEENANAKPLNKATLGWFKRYTYKDPEDAKTERASPFLASTEDPRGLEPATFVTAEIDPLRQQGLDYAGKLKAAGVPVEVRLFKGVTHELFGMGRRRASPRNASVLRRGGSARAP